MELAPGQWSVFYQMLCNCTYFYSFAIVPFTCNTLDNTNKGIGSSGHRIHMIDVGSNTTFDIKTIEEIGKRKFLLNVNNGSFSSFQHLTVIVYQNADDWGNRTRVLFSWK